VLPYLLRVRVPDHPGALGRLATAIGAVGADIESIAVVDRTATEAIDDLIVDLPAPILAEHLVTATHSVPGAVLEVIQRHPGRARVRDELALLDVAAGHPSPLAALIEGLPDLFAARYALALDSRRGPRPVAATAGAPDKPMRTKWLPLSRGRTLRIDELFTCAVDGGPDCELIAVPLGATAAVVLARNGGAPFRESERLRLEHLTALLQFALRDRPEAPVR
jgi:ACT domain